MIELDERCTTIVALSTRYLEGALEPAVHTSYETHLVFCEACTSYLADIRTLTRQARALPPDSVNEDERRRILAAAAEREAT